MYCSNRQVPDARPGGGIVMAVYDKAYELARDLRQSEEYEEYRNALEAIKGHDTAMSLLRDYRKAQVLVQTAFLTGKEPDESLKKEFARIQELVNLHGPVKRFIEAEERVLLMLADVQRIITDSLELLDYSRQDV